MYSKFVSHGCNAFITHLDIYLILNWLSIDDFRGWQLNILFLILTPVVPKIDQWDELKFSSLAEYLHNTQQTH